MDELSAKIKETLATPLFEEDAHPMSPKEREKVLRQLWGMLVVLSILIVVLFAGAVSISKTQGQITDAINDARHESLESTLANRETGYKNRAVNCQIAIALSQPVLDSCREPEVLKYYDPTIPPTAGGNSAAQAKLRALICLDLQSKGIEPYNCEDVNTPVPGT